MGRASLQIMISFRKRNWLPPHGQTPSDLSTCLAFVYLSAKWESAFVFLYCNNPFALHWCDDDAKWWSSLQSTQVNYSYLSPSQNDQDSHMTALLMHLLGHLPHFPNDCAPHYPPPNADIHPTISLWSCYSWYLDSFTSYRATPLRGLYIRTNGQTGHQMVPRIWMTGHQMVLRICTTVPSVWLTGRNVIWDLLLCSLSPLLLFALSGMTPCRSFPSFGGVS